MDEAIAMDGPMPGLGLNAVLMSPLWDAVRDNPKFDAWIESLGYSSAYRSGRAAIGRMRRAAKLQS